MSWERRAVRTGGTVAGLAAAAADGGWLVFAATSVGVFGSSDAGRTWVLPDAGAGMAFAEVVAPSPGFAHDHTLVASAGEALYRSSDAGQSWRQVLIGSRMLTVGISHGGLV